jgi:hypothetical protein
LPSKPASCQSSSVGLVASWAEVRLHQLRAPKCGTNTQTGMRQGCWRERLSGTRSERRCEWAAPEQSRGGARLFGPFHMSVCRGLLSNGPSSIDQLSRAFAGREQLERRRLSDGNFPTPPTKQNMAVWQGWGGTRTLSSSCRADAEWTLRRRRPARVGMTNHLTATLSSSAQGRACRPAWQRSVRKVKEEQHDGRSQKATTAPACGSGMMCP